MDYSAANSGMWSLIITLGLLALALGISLILRAKIPAIRRMMMPTAVLAGFILLFFKEVHLIELNTDILEMLVYHTIAMGFIAMSLRKALRPKGDDGKRTGQLTGLKSGAIIVGALIIGLARTVAAEYAFYLAIPAMLGASVIKIAKFGMSFTGTELAALILGSAVAFVVSIFVVRFFMKFVSNHDFKIFGYYRIVLGAVVILCAAAGFIQ